MSKPIKLTEALIQSIVGEFTKAVRDMKMSDGKITYTKNFKWSDGDKNKAKIIFTPLAFAKMTRLVHGYSDEVAWHGCVTRSETEANKFFINDILVYPQIVTGGTVDTDQDEYTKWLYGLDDDVFNTVRLQGHSHVNFSVSPSLVDTSHQEQILEQMNDDMFYIFVIWNKKFEKFIRVYDLKNNILYETDDCEVFVGDETGDLDGFFEESAAMVRKKTAERPNTAPATPSQTPDKSWNMKYQVFSSMENSEAKKEKTKEKKTTIGNGWSGRTSKGIFDESDYEDRFGWGYPYNGSYGSNYK